MFWGNDMQKSVSQQESNPQKCNLTALTKYAQHEK